MFSGLIQEGKRRNRIGEHGINPCVLHQGEISVYVMGFWKLMAFLVVGKSTVGCSFDKELLGTDINEFSFYPRSLNNGAT